MTSGKILKEARKQLRMTAKELASVLGFSEAYILMIENGQRNITPEFLIMLENSRKFDNKTIQKIAYLVNDEVKDVLVERIERKHGAVFPKFSHIDYKKTVGNGNEASLSIPIYEYASAGGGQIAWRNSELAKLKIPFHRYKNCIAVKIQGESMLGVLDSGDWVLIRPQNTAESGQTIIATIGEFTFCKKLKYSATFPDRILLVSENRAYDDIPVHPADDFAIQGIVVLIVKWYANDYEVIEL